MQWFDLQLIELFVMNIYSANGSTLYVLCVLHSVSASLKKKRETEIRSSILEQEWLAFPN
jgi:hypothetical protein